MLEESIILGPLSAAIQNNKQDVKKMNMSSVQTYFKRVKLIIIASVLCKLNKGVA
jgi:hypothetical protein